VAVGIVIAMSAIAGRATAQTVTWERKAFGQQQTNGCGDPFTWPNNNFWSQDQLILTACNSNYVAEPSNWSTPGFPNSASVDVILGAGGAPGTHLDVFVTLKSLTIQSVGALNMGFGSSVAATSFLFEGDGNLTNVGGGGPDPVMTINSGGSMTKTGGAGSYTIANNVRLNSTNATIGSLSGSLVLPGNSGTQTNPTFNTNAGTSVVLVQTGGTQYLRGNVQSTGAGNVVHNAGTIVAGTWGGGPGGAELNFPGASFQWSGGVIQTIAADRPLVNAGTINVTGPVTVSGIFFSNSASMIQSGAGAFNVPFGSHFTNNVSGVYDLRNDNGITGSGGGGPNPQFNNKGLFRKSAGSGVSNLAGDGSLLFNHLGGTVQVDTGTVRFGKGDSTGANFIVAAGASVDLTGGFTFTNYAGTYTGSGAGRVELVNGNLNTSGSGTTFNFPPNLFQWLGGAIVSQASRPFLNTGTMTLAGAGDKFLFGVSTNNGTLIQNGAGALHVPSGSQFTNGAAGVLDLRTDGGIGDQGGGGPNPTLLNQGVIRKSAGGGTSVFGNGLFVTNSGTLEPQSGAIQIRLFTQESGTTR
jgi:hypothetical protein